MFDEVYKTANVSSAAERLGISQSAASTALAKGCTPTGDKLLVAHLARHGTHALCAPDPAAGARYPRPAQPRHRAAARCSGPATAECSFIRSAMTGHQRGGAAAGPARPPAARGAGRAHRDRDHPDRERPPARRWRGRPRGVGFMPRARGRLLPADAVDAEPLRSPGRAQPSARGRPADASASRPRRTRWWPPRHRPCDRRQDHRAARAAAPRGDAVVELPASVARIVAHTEQLVVVPRILGRVLATQEPVQLLEPPFELPSVRGQAALARALPCRRRQCPPLAHAGAAVQRGRGRRARPELAA